MKNTDIGKIQKYISTYVINDYRKRYLENQDNTVKFGYISINKSEYVLKL